MDPIEQEVRAANPDWTDAQVAEEVARRKAADPPAPTPNPEHDAAFARMRRERDEAQRERDRLKAEADQRARQEAEQQGEWEKLAKQYEQERDAARDELAKLKQQIKVEGIAKRLKFRHADEAIALLPASVDRDSDQAVEEALRTLGEERKHLIEDAATAPTGAPAGGTGGGTRPLSKAEIERMSPEEINERWPEVQASLKALEVAQ